MIAQSGLYDIGSRFVWHFKESWVWLASLVLDAQKLVE